MVLVECHGIREDKLNIISEVCRSSVFFSLDAFLFERKNKHSTISPDDLNAQKCSLDTEDA